MTTRLASMDHVTPYYLIGHIQQARKKKMDTGLLIHRIKSKDPAPQLNQNFHLLKCNCFECFNLVYYHDHGYLPPEDFAFEDYQESIQTVDSFVWYKNFLYNIFLFPLIRWIWRTNRKIVAAIWVNSPRNDNYHSTKSNDSHCSKLLENAVDFIPFQEKRVDYTSHDGSH